MTPSSDLSRTLRAFDDSTELSTQARAPLVERMATETVMGVLLGAGGLVAGGLMGGAIGQTRGPCSGEYCSLKRLDYLGAGAVAGVALLTPLGVYIGGSMADGQGLFLPTLAGSLASGGLTVLALSTMDSLSSAGVLALVLSPLVGSLIGYEVSHYFVSRKTGVQVLPTVGVSSSGTGVLGLAGRF